jgi:hypothetical protein
VLEITETPQNSLTYATDIWLATQKVIRRNFDPAERTELDMLVLKAWRRDPAQASVDFADLPEGMRATLVQAAAKAGRCKLGYVVQHGEDLVAAKAAQYSHEVADAARAGVPPDPTYDDERMLRRLSREAQFHRDSRRQLTVLLISSSPFGSRGKAELLVRPGENIYPRWMHARLAMLIRYLSNDHRLRMLTYLDDKRDQLAPARGDRGFD